MSETFTAATANSEPYIKHELDLASARTAVLSTTVESVDTVTLKEEFEAAGYRIGDFACAVVDLLENRQIKLNLDRTLEKSSKL